MRVRVLQRRSSRGLALAAALACVLALGPGEAADAAPTTVEEAERTVEEAEGQLRDARSLSDGLSRDLDAAAYLYEHANAHRLRLEEEADAVESQVDVALAQAAEAEARFARQVASAYMRPEVDLVLAESVVLAPDAGTAMHRVALVSRVTWRQRLQADRAHAVVDRTTDSTKQHQVVRSGVLGAEQDARERADDLRVALSNAQHLVRQAESSLEAAEATRDRLVEEERRIAAIAARASGPLPPVDGKVCPIGAPNGFIDSWGFPRSGGRRHQGVDMFAAYGMPIYAVADGTVRVFWNRLGGLSINLIDTDGHRYYYAHLSETVVESGERVRAGQVIGANGDTGNARGTPPHLHWQYHPGNGPAVNPYPLAKALCR